MNRRLIDRYTDSRRHQFQARLAYVVRRSLGDQVLFWLARVFYRLQIMDEDRMPATGPCIFVMNHVSLLADALVYLVVRRTRPTVHIYAWQSFQGESPMYDFLRGYGEPNLEERFIRVYKARGYSAQALIQARNALQQGEAVVIAAEGCLTWDGRLQYPLEPGAVWMALHTQAPIVPIVSVGGYDVQPYWRFEKMYRTGRITIRVGKALHFERPSLPITPAVIESSNERLWQTMHDLIQTTPEPLRRRLQDHG